MGFGRGQPTTTWKLSGILVALGAIGIGFILLALEIGTTSNTDATHYTQGFYACIGVGIMLIGSSWILARAAPRMK